MRSPKPDFDKILLNFKRAQAWLLILMETISPMPQRISAIFLLLALACGPSKKEGKETALQIPAPRETIEGGERTIPVYDYEGLKPLLHREDDTIYIVNFWATWCAPCIKELPYFERISKENTKEEVQVVLVSLDMPRMWDSHLVPFVEEKGLTSQVVVLDDPKQNTWIPLIDENWSGAIPATLIYKNGNRKFYEQPFTYEELSQELSKFKM